MAGSVGKAKGIPALPRANRHDARAVEQQMRHFSQRASQHAERRRRQHRWAAREHGSRYRAGEIGRCAPAPGWAALKGPARRALTRGVLVLDEVK